ncbi:hypothetical protein BS47DRAFT_1387607 [Hydnum rufescens UP504]|uniref:Uncharacterized protein n=1 Tax=Hydnum rufescens UP504 TaxID=1448309 RepID=A0A9P6B9A6_9AGAM|nr:hypothetical protein BS47DRAFT_1387607 [Hydnum rufescens UP504]
MSISWSKDDWYLAVASPRGTGKWIELHLINDISGVLLILSRAFDWGENRGSEGVITSLGSVLASLPDNPLNEAGLAVDSEKANYKQKLEVLQQLIEDEAEQEQKGEDARRAKKELEERLKHEEARTVESMLPDSEETFGEASPSQSLSKRIRGMLTKIDTQLCDYDARVGSSLQLISVDSQGRITVRDLKRALGVIKHKPDAKAWSSGSRQAFVTPFNWVSRLHIHDRILDDPAIGLENGELIILGFILRRDVFDPAIIQVCALRAT